MSRVELIINDFGIDIIDGVVTGGHLSFFALEAVFDFLKCVITGENLIFYNHLGDTWTFNLMIWIPRDNQMLHTREHISNLPRWQHPLELIPYHSLLDPLSLDV